jgi:molybdate transport system substrate-binding protein
MKRLAALLGVVLVLGGCGDHAEQKQLIVFAAASLTDTFRAIVSSFERSHPGVTVRLSFGASSGLATQIEEGAPADVFASAGTAETDRLARAVGITQEAIFARNRLVVIVPESNPARIGSLTDLARPGVRLVIAAATVPAGRYARAVLAKAGIERPVLANVASNEPDVKGVVQKVMSGDADAGLAYTTDVGRTISATVTTIEIPPRFEVLARYPIAILRSSHHLTLARAFFSDVMGDGQATLRAFGFLPP